MALSMETLHLLAYAADWMACESNPSDRNGQDASDLRKAADEARKESLRVSLCACGAGCEDDTCTLAELGE